MIKHSGGNCLGTMSCYVLNYSRNEQDIILKLHLENVTGSEYMKAQAPS